MENTKKYEYILDQMEIKEFCFYAVLEKLKCKKRVWICLVLICALELILLPQVAVFLISVILLLLLASVVRTYRNVRKSVSNQQWTVQLAEGKLKVDRGGGSSEIPYGNIQLIRVTNHLLMLGYLHMAQHPVWFVLPLRIFADVQEQEQFLYRFRQPQPAQYEETGKQVMGQESTDREPEGISFTYVVDDRKWVHFQKSAMAVISSGTLGKKERGCAVFLGGVLASAILLGCVYLVAGYFNWMLVGYGLCIALLLTMRLFFRDPEKALNKQIKMPAIRNRECGKWQVTLSEAGVSVEMPADARNDFRWETLEWLVEAENAFLIFHKDKKHFIIIAKESFQSWDQVSAMKELCARKGLKILQGRKMYYVPDWLIAALAAFFFLLCVVLLIVSIFLSYVRETREQLQRASQEHDGMKWQEDFDPADYPDYVPLDDQVEVLESFGFDVPEEIVKSARDSMTEYGLYASVEGYPYTWLLTNLGAPQYNEDWTATEEYSKGVFWFDFEGWDYIDILNGMLALAEDSCLDTVTNINEDDSKVNWERGKGTLTVSLEWDGQTYHWDMNVYYDWIDSDVLGMLNALLIEGKSQKFFYVTGDNGQGAIVFFCTAEWAEDFREATGLELVNYRTWSVEQRERAKTS